MSPVVCFSQSITKGVVSCQNITPTLTSGQGHCQPVSGQSAHCDPGMCPYQATILWQLDGPVHPDVDPAPVMVGQTARRMHVVWKLKAIVQWRSFEQQIEHASVPAVLLIIIALRGNVLTVHVAH